MNSERESYEKFEDVAQKLGVEKIIDLLREMFRVPGTKLREPLLHLLVKEYTRDRDVLGEVPMRRLGAQHVRMMLLAREAAVRSLKETGADRVFVGWSITLTICTLKHVAKYHVLELQPPPKVKAAAAVETLE